ncbi:MAG: hypothetical protein ACO1SV_27795 [Fimbriimonas sp.]
MQILYIVSAIVAGVLIVLSLVGAGDAEHDSPTGEFNEAVHETFTDHWLPFFSLRFYTYFFAGFGTTGLLLQFLTKTDPTTSAIISGVVGFGTGLVVSYLVRLLRVTEASGEAKEKDFLSKDGLVLVPIRGGTPGKIRLSVKGDAIDILATTEEDQTIEAGEAVVVVAMENGRAQVVLRDSLFGDPEPQKVS